MKRALIAVVSFLLVTGCLAPEDLAQFGILKVSPANGSDHNGASSIVGIQLTGAVDEASLGGVTLGTDLPRETDVSFDDSTNTIWIDPLLGLSRNTTYTVSLSGVTSADQHVLPDTELTFGTLVNPTQTEASFDPSGNQYQQLTTITDAEARPVDQYSSVDPGPDGVWGNEDDDLNGRVTTSYDGGVTRQILFTAPGPDGQWFTNDDFIQVFIEKQVLEDETYLTVNYDDAGPDGELFTADDVISGYSTNQPLPGGFHLVSYDDPGPDAGWFTEDDVWLLSLKRYREGLMLYTLSSSDEGPDGELGTLDDPGGLTVTDLNAFGTAYYSRFLDFGPDGEYLTEDDVVQASDEWTLGDLGEQLSHAGFDAAGVQDSLSLYEYSEDGIRIAEQYSFDPGPDGVFGTADDVIAARTETQLDERGSRIQTTYFDDPGPDGTWYTEDDRIADIESFDTTK